VTPDTATVTPVTRGPATVYVVRLTYDEGTPQQRVRLAVDGRGVPIFFDPDRAEQVAARYRPDPAPLFDTPTHDQGNE
jgi:hypothetical protein